MDIKEERFVKVTITAPNTIHLQKFEEYKILSVSFAEGDMKIVLLISEEVYDNAIVAIQDILMKATQVRGALSGLN